MHDLPTNDSLGLSPPATPEPQATFNWWKTSLIVMVCLAIVVCWLGTERSLVRPGATVPQAEVVKYSAAESRRLVQQYASDPSSLSDDEYQTAALAQEALMKRERQSRRQPSHHSFSNPHDRWQESVNQLRDDLSGIKEFPEGSVQWHMRKRLEEMLVEEPGQ